MSGDRYPATTSSLPALAVRGALAAILVVLACALAVAVVPQLLGLRTLVVRGGSMGDAQPVGSLVLARIVPASDVVVGDVVVLREPGAAMPKIHRVVAVLRREAPVVVRTKGDANGSADPTPYALTDQASRVVATVPYLGYLVTFMAQPLGWVLVIALPAAVLCFSAVRRIWELDGRIPTRA